MPLNLRLLGLVLAFCAAGVAAQNFPSRAVRVIVPLAAGGTGDTLARLVGEELAKSLGAPFVIENRPGAGGIIGTEAVAKSAPDGYTLLHTSSSHVMHPALRPALPYDALRDFAVIAHTADTHQVLLAHPGFPAHNVQDLLTHARKSRVFYGSAGNGSATHLHMELLKSLAGIELEHVPYKGSTQARTDLLKLKALAIASSRRSPAAADIPTLSEAGVPAYKSDTWYALFAPAGVPAPVLELLRKAARSALESPALREKFVQQGAEPSATTPAQLEELMRVELARWGKVVADARIKAD